MSVLIATLILFTTASPIFAVEPDPGEIDALLMERGFPSEVVSRMDEMQKQMLLDNPDVGYLGSFSIQYSESPSAGNGMQPYGQIPTSDLTLTFDVTCQVDDGEFAQLLIFFYYNWNNLPFWRVQDPIALSWDETKFRLKDNTFYKIDYYSAYLIGLDQSVTWYHGVTHSYEKGYAQASPSGVSWYADLKANVGLTLVMTELYGHGAFILVPAHGTTVYEGETSTIYAHYVHALSNLNLSIAVSSFGSFDISGLSGYDERGTQYTFTIENTFDED